MASEFHVVDTGTKLQFTLRDQAGVIVNLRDNSNLLLVIERGDSSVIERTAMLLTDGTDGKVYYVTTAQDLTVAGTYHFQVYVSFPGGLWHSTIVKYKVRANLE